tara:strand:+ start:28 stop:972 length:945 start_codon:yes stop_codon:yes gene_type:complete
MYQMNDGLIENVLQNFFLDYITDIDLYRDLPEKTEITENTVYIMYTVIFLILSALSSLRDKLAAENSVLNKSGKLDTQSRVFGDYTKSNILHLLARFNPSDIFQNLSRYQKKIPDVFSQPQQFWEDRRGRHMMVWSDFVLPVSTLPHKLMCLSWESELLKRLSFHSPNVHLCKDTSVDSDIKKSEFVDNVIKFVNHPVKTVNVNRNTSLACIRKIEQLSKSKNFNDKLLIDLLLFVEDEYLSYKLHRVDNILMCSNLKGLCGVVRYYKYINANETNNFFEYFDFEQQQNIQIDSSCLQHCIQNVNEKLNTFFRN